MNQHYIVCGIKDIGLFVAYELHETQRPFVVIEQDEAAIDSLRDQIPSLVSLHGDASDDSLLEQANVGNARGLIACLENDKDNIYLVLAAREVNSQLQIAAKYNAPSSKAKLIKAGAAHLVCPYRIGGMRIISELLRPQVVSFLDRMLRNKSDTGIRVEEVLVPEGSAMLGKPLAELQRATGILIISYLKEGHEDFEYNPGPTDVIEPGMKLLFIGVPEQRGQLEHALQ